MRKTILYLLLMLLSCGIYAQNKPAKIHLYGSKERGIWMKFNLMPYHPTTNKSIAIKSGKYIIIETALDSIAFAVNGKPFYIKINKGGDTYYRLYSDGSQDTISKRIMVDKISEEEFMWTLLFNEHESTPDEIFKF